MPAGSGDRRPGYYERGRSGWPSEVIELAGLPPTATVLDLGAGTGKLTRVLRSRGALVLMWNVPGGPPPKLRMIGDVARRVWRSS